MDINKTLTELRTELNTLVENLHPAVKVVSAAAKYAELSRLHADAVIKNAENSVNAVAQSANSTIEISLNEVQEHLLTVKKELDSHLEKTDTQIQNIENSVKVVTQSANSAIEISLKGGRDHLLSVKKELDNHLEKLEHVEKEVWLRQKKLLGDLHDSTEKSIQEVVSVAHQNMTDNRKETQEALILVKSQLSDAINNIQLIVSDEMAIVKDDMVKILHEIPLFVQKAEQLLQKIDSVNFPQRLDKIDTNVTALNIGFQTNQQKLEHIEVAFRSEMNKATEMMNKLGNSNRLLLVLLIVNILITLGGGALALLIFR